MLAKNFEQAAIVNNPLWPECLNEPLSYEEQVKVLTKKIIELDARVTLLENEINSENEE